MKENEIVQKLYSIHWNIKTKKKKNVLLIQLSMLFICRVLTTIEFRADRRFLWVRVVAH